MSIHIVRMKLELSDCFLPEADGAEPSEFIEIVELDPDSHDVARAWLLVHNSVFTAPQSSSRTGRSSGWSVRRFQTEFAHRSGRWQVLLAARSKQALSNLLVGVIAIRGQQDEATLNWLSVLPEFRSRGIGRSLVTAAVRVARIRKLKSLQLETLSSWSDAIRLYEQCGFQKVQ
ncbi:MAG: GNAT family N-acetyltransferase [Planctomycetales bacterium]|nr:GNAT family N-acetyltransferase [Planctomycetales bacterium]